MSLESRNLSTYVHFYIFLAIITEINLNIRQWKNHLKLLWKFYTNCSISNEVHYIGFGEFLLKDHFKKDKNRHRSFIKVLCKWLRYWAKNVHISSLLQNLLLVPQGRPQLVVIIFTRPCEHPTIRSSWKQNRNSTLR